jgi:hypothetical protein
MYFLMHEATDTVPASSTLQSSSAYLKDFTFFAAERLQRVIKAQQATVEKLRAVDEASVEYRIEAQTLQRLLDAQEKLIKTEAAA